MARRRRPPRPGLLADLSPTRIASQIVLLQLAYYACAGFLIVFTALVAGKEISLDLVFNWETLRGDTTVGWTLGLVWILNSLTRYAALLHGNFLVIDTLQCYIHSPPYCAFETRPRLRSHRTLCTPDCHLLIHARDTLTPLLVGTAVDQRNNHDFSWRVGVSVARVEAYKLRCVQAREASC